MERKRAFQKNKHAFCGSCGMLFARKRFVCSDLNTCYGQASVEAAFLIPVLFVSLLLLMQPGILLYDRMVMNAAASEACRLLATKTDVMGAMDESCKAFVLHRLDCIPSVPCFHVGEDSGSWEISLQGDENSDEVEVAIAHEIRPLPLINVGSKLLGIINERGNFEIQVVCREETQPDWIHNTKAGHNPSGWIGAWLS